MGSLIWFSRILCLSFMLLQFLVQSSSPSQSSLHSPPHLCSPEERSALLDFKSTTNLVGACFGPFGTPRPIIQTWNESKDCCLWEGITCDEPKGHVIGLDLSGNCLEANLTINSSLFHLQKVQSLNLAYNEFSYPSISFGFHNWKSLTYLNLSYSGYMDGSLLFEIFMLPKLVSLDLSNDHGLLLDNTKFQLLVHNLTKLRILILDGVNMSLVVPSSLLNLTSSLEQLSLRDCSLQGNFPSLVFQLPSLQLIDLSYNHDLRGNLPRSNWSSPLKYLNLNTTSFLGELPHSIGNLKLPKELHLYHCQFYGSIPRSLANLTKITHLDFDSNLLQGEIPDVFGKMHKLTHLNFFNNSFSGEIPTSIFNLTDLTYLSLSSNKLIGPLPHNISGLSFLDEFRMDNNFITGHVPSWLFSLPSLSYLDLKNNKLTGPIDHVEIPNLILQEVYLFNNEISGSIPSFFFHLMNLVTVDLSLNNLNGTITANMISKLRNGPARYFFQQIELRTLKLNGNQLEGILPRSLVNCRSLEILDVGNNNLNDTFPHWLGVLPSLRVLILRSNRFHDAISNSMPAFYFPQLRIIDVAQNDFTGLLPSDYFKILKGMREVALADKVNLEYIGDEQDNGDKLDNGTMRCVTEGSCLFSHPHYYYKDSVKVVMKGLVVQLERISTIFTTIDFSSNQFHGEIPEELGELNSLIMLNLSHNSLTSQIPSSLGKLAELESLDLSSNKLEGRIPEQLTNLTFLSVLNLSHNELVGHIPEGKQFNTFSNDSYIGNSGLCGFPLTKNCHEEEEPGAPPKFDEEDDSATLFEWKFALAGYGCGLVLGLSLGYIAFTTAKPWWMVKKVEKYQQKLVEGYNRRHKKRKTKKPNQRS